MLNSARPRSGRRPGTSDSKGAILKSARRLFAQRGYDGTSVRAVAAGARVDPALVLHFFGSKAELFASSLELPIDPAELEALLEGDRTTLGRRIAAFYFRRIFMDRRQTVLSLLRSAVSNPEAAAMLRRAVESSAVAVLERILPGEEAALRGELCASQMMGLFLARHILGVEPLASEDEERLIDVVAPALQHYLDAPLPRRRVRR
ncbi:MAG TPA: TetR family transcriptional regulator [Myxococcales bacterium]|nr:TetR family transcriptional regulator [Myxococcales bacterium]